VLTVAETTVRNWERRRLAAEARARGISVAQLAGEERRERLAGELAALIARRLPARLGATIAAPSAPAPPPVAPPAPPPPAQPAPPLQERQPSAKAAVNDIPAMVHHIQSLHYR
jgi:hypothetical protein